MKSKRTFAVFGAGVLLFCLRLTQNRLGFEPETGLALQNLWTMLPFAAAGLLAAGCFLTAQKRETRCFADAFAQPDGLPLALLVTGGCLLMAGGGCLCVSAVGNGLFLREQIPLLLSAGLGVLSGAGVLVLVWEWRRAEKITVAPLLPLLFLLPILLLWVYLETATDPILARVALPVLAAAAGSLATAQLAGFFYGEKDSRWFAATACLGAALGLAVLGDAWLPVGFRVMLGGIALLLLSFHALLRRE